MTKLVDITPDYSSRITIFKNLTTDEVTNSVNEQIFSGLLTEYYNEFIEKCDYIRDNVDTISFVSCYIDMGVLKFDIIKK